ncbi:TRL-like family protein [Leptospira langatensis]|uniref:TRL-like family protein n=1 Tax=Leptospira langatensis TaxID=2484983 RepID=A0A5F1ZWS9_9LEPT|nr:TRL domain-containing protein [Leptospira langatensis]TGJ98210.1 TRL-like family protein [Leptospira langatensis]TGL43124.1 TRL-like family protein [Leptospira langatensis]
MKKTILFILISLSASASFNCATSILPAAIFGSAEYHVSGTPTGGPTDARILKSGKSCNNYSLLNVLFYSGGEGSIVEAAQKAGIKKIAVVDKSVFSIFAPLFSRECVVVYGE